MSPASRSTTAIESARIAYDLLRLQQIASTTDRRRHDRIRFIRLAMLLCGGLALLIGGAVFGGAIPLRFLHGKSPIGASPGGADGDGIGITRTGQVRSFVTGDICRELQFHNDRGLYTSGRFGPCDILLNPKSTGLPKGSRMEAIRDAFAR